ncbi:MAG: GNAT family protein [Thermoplasmata archaeon]|jgi:N-acetyltransferase
MSKQSPDGDRSRDPPITTATVALDRSRLAPGSFRPPVVLSGRYVRLVPLSAEQLPGLVTSAADPEIWTYFRGGDLRTEAAMRTLITELLERQADGTDLPFAVLDRSNDRPIGMSRYLEIDRPNSGVEIGGTWLGREHWRTPLNTEMKLLMLCYAFEVGGVHRVQIKTDLRNERAQRAIERLGAVREGILREHVLLGTGYRRSSVYYSVLEDEWPSVQLRLEGLLARPWDQARSG